jgi:hypothetical protein
MNKKGKKFPPKKKPKKLKKSKVVLPFETEEIKEDELEGS